MFRVDLLYPQYKTIRDRRQDQVPVTFERRSGEERRSEDRVCLDTNLTRDIFEIKSKMSQSQTSNPITSTEKVAFTQNSSKAVLNSIKNDEFVKSEKSANTEENKKIDTDKDSVAPLAIGLLACTLGGVVASSFLGAAGAVMAVGVGAYIGGKLIKQLVSSHMNDKDV